MLFLPIIEVFFLKVIYTENRVYKLYMKDPSHSMGFPEEKKEFPFYMVHIQICSKTLQTPGIIIKY